jgi:chromosome segregation ATPase
MNVELETTFKQIAAQFVEKQADLKALEQQRKAAGLRLDDFIKREAAAKVALQQVNAALDQANKELSQARREAAKIKADAIAEGNAIVAAKRKEADGFLRGVMSAVQAAASLIKKTTPTTGE